jgi:hypothetical protein
MGIMPRGRKTDAAKDERAVEWGGFIDPRLSDDDKLVFNGWVGEHYQLTFIEDLLADEMKVSFSYDRGNETVVCSLTSERMISGMRLVLTARSSTWERALQLAMYKHYILMDGDWGKFKPSTGRGPEV